MRVLVACEYSGRVRDAFARLGHDSVSCDLLPSDVPGGAHYKGDVFDIINDGWDLMIAHPPCTFLCSSGLRWNKGNPGRALETERGLEFVRRLLGASIDKIALENPVGRIGTAIRPADQYIHPYEFGHSASKKTGLWLKGLSPLVAADPVPPRVVWGGGKWAMRWDNQTDSGQNCLPPSDDRWKIRSETYEGIAEAMAYQWG